MSYILALTSEDMSELIKNPNPSLTLEKMRHDSLSCLIVLAGLLQLTIDDFETYDNFHTALDEQLIQLTSLAFDKKYSEYKSELIQSLRNFNYSEIPNIIERFDFSLITAEEYKVHDFLDNGIWIKQNRIEPEPLIRDFFPRITTGSEIFNDEQVRLSRHIIANEEDNFNLQGFAGVGKSTLCKMISDGLVNTHKAKPLYIASTTPQKYYMMKILENKIPCLSISQVAYLQLNADKIWGCRTNYKPLSDRQLVNYRSLTPINSHSASEVAGILKQIVNSYCKSKDPYISSQHVPFVGRANAAKLIVIAQSLWNDIINSPKNSPLPMHPNYLVKLLSLRNRGLTKDNQKFTHIIIDEVQNFKPSALKIISDTTELPVIQLKDEMQNLSLNSDFDQSSIGYKEMIHTMRQGAEVTPILNHQINCYNPELVSNVRGSNKKNTVIEYYEKIEISKTPTAILSKSPWILLRVVFLLESLKKDYLVLPESNVTLIKFLEDLKYLRVSKNYMINNFRLKQFKDWSEFSSSNTYRNLSKELQAFILSPERVFELVKILKNKLIKKFYLSDRVYYAGFAEDSKSLEFKCVMITKDMFAVAHSDYLKKGSRELYLAISRAREKLYLPTKSFDIVAFKS